MSNLTLGKGDLRYLRIGLGGTVSGLLFSPTASPDSPASSLINKQYITDNVPTLDATDARYARLDGAVFAGSVLLNGATPVNPRTAIDKGHLDASLSARDPSLAVLVPDSGNAIEWTPSPYTLARINLPANNTALSISVTQQEAGAMYKLIVVQPPSSGGGATLAFSSQFCWPSGLMPTLTTTPGATDLFTFVSTGQKLLSTGQTDYINAI